MTGPVDKVVIIVLDGLRPDMIAGRMPHLDAFVRESLWFREARSVFPSETRVATTSTATGCWPGRHGIVGNGFHIPHILAGQALNTADFAHLALFGPQSEALVTADSLGQALARAGRRMGAVHGGTPGAAFLVNHDVAANRHWTVSVHGAAATRTPEAVHRATALCGALPGNDVPKFDCVAYAGQVLRTMALGDDQPDVSLIWLPEPDTSFHRCGIGSAQSRAVMAAADTVFAEIVDHIRSGPHGARTAIIAMSDHGQISTTRKVDLAGLMRADGLPVADRPDAATRIAMTNGISGELRMLSDDPGLPAAVVDWLTGRDEIGMVFARDDLADLLPGTLPLSLVHQSHPRGAELRFVMRSDTGMDADGLPGRGLYTSGVAPGGGMHGGLNLHEMNTVLAIDTPGGRHAQIDRSPAALVDIAPTVLSLLDVPFKADGRILPLYAPEADPVEEVSLEARRPGFRQCLIQRHVGARIYLDYGERLV